MAHHVGELNPPVRLMLTPGPSSMDPRVYRALSTPLVGHVDPWFRGCMEDTQVLLRQIFQTENRITMPLSASGSGGIEASLVNSLEEGDEAIVCVNGWFFGSHGRDRVAHRRHRYAGGVSLRHHRRSRRCAQSRQRPQNQDHRPGAGRNLFRRADAARGLPRSCRRTRRFADRGHRSLARRRPAQRGQRTRGHLFQRHAESHQRASGHVAHHGQSQSRRSLPQPQNKSAELVLRSHHRHELLGQGPPVSSHPADFADLRVARSHAHGPWKKGWKTAGSVTARINWR